MADNVKIKVLCPVCHNSDADVLYEPWNVLDDPERLYGAASGVPGTQRLVRCSCGMIYESPRYADDVILKGYMSSLESGHDSQYPMRVDSFFRALKRLEDKLPAPGARVLDIGTAGGAFLDAATRFGYRATGMEPSRDLVERGAARGLDIHQGTIDSHDFAPGTFDMITLWDVIEHLTDPAGALVKIRELLKPDGVLLINFPDIGTTQAKLAGKKFWWILSVHLYHFSRPTMDKLCANAGYEVFSFTRYWQTLQFGYLEEMAIHYRLPLAKLLTRLTPKFIREIPVPYYASQTTAIARIRK